MIFAGLLLFGSGLLFMTLASIPLLGQIAAGRHKLQTFNALRSRDFRWFWISTTTQAVGRGMQFLILGWLVLVITDSTTQLGVVILLYGLPNLAFVLFGGNLWPFRPMKATAQ